MDKPGTIVRVKVSGKYYSDLLAQAKVYFGEFFDTPWQIIGAEIQPGQVSEGIGSSEIITWDGMFYAMPREAQTDDGEQV